MTTFKVPNADELRAQLTGLGRLLTARKWERAAIVFAFTEVGEVGRGRWHKPEPPRMYIREFAAQGFSGLTTNKSVSRYRDAWVSAVSNGWTTLAEPGWMVQIPEQPFPAWPYGEDDEDGTVTITEADENVAHMHSYRGPHRPLAERVLSQLESSTKALERLAEEFDADGMSVEQRNSLVKQLEELQKVARMVAQALRPMRSV